ncbi:MAG TPA: hypothetical protein VFR53_08565 [Methylomirabilota bacterium]|nr:hypothetical protein [Methylomirabilota bacterium]
MNITRPLLALATSIAIALPSLAAGETQSLEDPRSEEPRIEERPRDLPPWLFAWRLGPPADDRPRDESGLSDMSALLLRDTPSAPIQSDPLTLRSTGEDDSSDLRVLLGKGERWHLMRFGAAAASRPQEAKVTAYGAIAYVPPSLAASRPEGGLGYGPVVAPGAAFGLGLEEQEEPVSLGLKGAISDFEGGAEYRSVGKRLERLVSGPSAQRDREGTELWVAQRLGLVRMRLARSEQADNVDRNPALPRTTRAQTAISAQLDPRGWPIFGLTYATGRSARAWLTAEGRPRITEEQTFDSMSGNVYYGAPRWDVSTSSSYIASRDVAQADHTMAMFYHDLRLTLRPVESLVIAPAMSSGLERYEWSGTRSNTTSTSLLLSYGPPTSWWKLWTLGAYSASRASDGTVDGRTTSLSGGLSCGLGQLLGGPTSLSFQAGYERYDDSVYRDSSARGVFGLVRLKVVSF